MSLQALRAAGGPAAVKKWGMIEGNIWVNLWLLLTRAHMCTALFTHRGVHTCTFKKTEDLHLEGDVLGVEPTASHMEESMQGWRNSPPPRNYCVPSVRDRGT